MNNIRNINAMNVIVFLGVLLALTTIVQSRIDQGQPLINEVSLSQGTFVSPKGSELGGTKIYIKGTNFNIDSSKNLVYIGSYPCIPSADGNSENMIACETTPATNPNERWGLAVKVIVGSAATITRTTICGSQNCAFTYDSSSTPFIQEISPKTATGKQTIYSMGIHHISDLGDGKSAGAGQIVNLLIDGNTCSTIDVSQVDQMDPWSRKPIACNTYQNIQAGEYDFIEKLVPGFAKKSLRTQQTSFFTNNNYTMRIAPNITSMTIHEGGNKGHLLTLSGTGFTSNTANYQCKIAGQTCTLEKASDVSITVRVPELTPSNTAFGLLAKEAGDTSVQSKGYLGGQGFLYSRYDYSGSKTLDQWYAYVKTNPTPNVVKIVSQLSSVQIQDGSYVEYVRGYFYAPITGEYRFSGLADDYLIVKIAQFQNNENSPMTTLIYQSYYNTDRFNPYVNSETTVAKSINLSQGYYYLEVVSVNSGGLGYYKVGVDMPKPKPVGIINPVWQINKITIAPSDFLPEIITIDVYGASGTFKLYELITSQGLLVSSGSDFSLTDSATSFNQKLDYIPSLSGYRKSTTKEGLNVLGAVTVVAADIVGYRFTITVSSYRATPGTLRFTNNLVSGATKPSSVTITKTQVHSPPLSGTYRLNIGQDLKIWNGTAYAKTDIPFDTPAYVLENALRNMFPSTEIEVRKVMGYSFVDKIEFVIEFIGILADPGVGQLVVTTISGGKVGTSPVGTYQILRPYSAERQLYSPISYQFLRIASATPSLYLTVNKIPAVCLDCSYSFAAAKTILTTSSSLSSATLTVGLSNPGSVSFALSDITVTLLGVPCNTLTGSLSSFSCTFSTNANGTPKLPAGSTKPVVHIKQIGFADNSASSTVNIPLTVTSITPNTVAPGAGIPGTISGTGFPIDITGSVAIQLCGNVVTQITSVSNLQIVFRIPTQVSACASNSKITINGVVTPITFTYDPSLSPSISTLSPSSSSPIMKSSIRITGTNFGTSSNTKVFLSKAGVEEYELGIVNISSTEINCVLGGGKTGTYDVMVRVDNKGLSTASATSKFSYKIVISSISPSSGSLGGGYNLTITGYNFATLKGSSNVFVGQAKNSICEILAITTTQIICKVPRMDSTYTAGTPQLVVVTGRVLEQSLCEGSCSFIFNQAATKYINVPTITDYSAGTGVTVTAVAGTDLTGAKVSVGGVDCVITATSASSVTFTYPVLVAGSYEVLISAGGSNTHPAFVTTTTLSFAYGLSRSSGSEMGHIISLATNGLTNSPTDPNLIVWQRCGSGLDIKLKIISVAPNLLKFEVLPKVSDNICLVNVTYGTKFTNFQYTYSSASTPSVTLTKIAANSYTLTKTVVPTQTVNSVDFIYLDSSDSPTTSIYPMSLTASGSTYTLTPASGTLPAGKFIPRVHSDMFGYSIVTPSSMTIPFPSTPTATPVSSSYVGGKQLTINGQGFIGTGIANNDVTVCGIRATVKSVDSTSIKVILPALVTQYTQTQYQLVNDQVIKGTYYSDSPTNSIYGFDGSPNTVYTSSNAICYIGWNFGTGAVANIKSIRYMPNPKWAISASMLIGAVFEGSNDGIVWTTITAVDTTSVHSGWNYWEKAVGSTHKYQYVRFSHTSVSKCELADIEITGKVYQTLTITGSTNQICDVSIFDGTSTRVVLSNIVTYQHSMTSSVTTISPSFGPSYGNTQIRIQGTNFGTALTITIDGKLCTVINQTTTQVYCMTTSRPKPPAQGNSFVFVSDGNTAKIAAQPFKYVDRWSDQATWGGEALPREGDSAYIPKGMTLLVDVSTPILNAVIVQGKIQFADEADTTFDAHVFLINEGQFQAGLQSSPYQHKLTITLHGGYFDKQLPIFGNKVLGCRNCKFNMHGKVRDQTWTELASTILPGATTLTLITPVDWQVGETIAVASSSFDHYESEQRVISAVSADKKTLTVTIAFQNRHFSGIQTYDGQQFVMRAEVGLLSRNIKVQGNDQSVTDRYGSHLMMNGKQNLGLVAKISYTEFTKCGQPHIIGRYCTHFHMAGQVPESYVRGIAVHHSFARVITIHGTHFLLVEKNVGFRVEGHNFFIEDGIETNNVIQDNLAISSITSLTLLQSDITVASFWITNPYNTVRRNHAAGGDFYGFWYQIMENPSGPSATTDICPMGMQVGQSKDNVAHSNRRFGLRIFKLSARKFPCITTEDQTVQDPYIGNPAILSVFENYTLWRNQECGFLGQQLGYTQIRNFRTVDSRKGGLQFHKTNYTKENVVAKNCLIVGFSQNNAPADPSVDYRLGRGLIASRTDGLNVTGIRFHNFASTMTPLQSCSECWNIKLWVVGSKTTYFRNISYTNIQGNYIFWQKWRRQVFVDEDGTLLAPLETLLGITPKQTKGSITPYRPSVMIPSHCYHSSGATWDNSTYCDSTITLRSILFTNGIPAMDFNAIDIKARILSDPLENISAAIETEFSQQYMIIIKKSLDIKNSWAMPFVVGKYYNVHWKWGIDFTHMAVAPSRLWAQNEGLVLRFNYSDHRQLFQIGKWYSGTLQKPMIEKSSTLIDPSNCTNGQYFHNDTSKYLYVCVSGRNKKIREWTDLNGIKCLNYCPPGIADVQRENFERYWSNTSNWENNQLPAAGSNVTIKYEWNMVLDIDPPILNFVDVQGDLIFDRSRNNKFQAKYIWVSKGNITIGSPDSPFPQDKTAQIILHGEKDSDYLVIDPDASGNKMLAVTGGLKFYGSVTTNIWTRLIQIAAKGSNTIKVTSASGWKVNDEIVIAPSYAGRKQQQVFKISAISGNTITLNSTLVYQHYGSATITVDNGYGKMDARSAVGLLTRNIKISRGPDVNGWGCRVLVYSYLDIPIDLSATNQPKIRNGWIKFSGVQLNGCGQYDTGYAGIRMQKLGTLEKTQARSEITLSSVHNCVGICMYITDVSNVSITNNVFYWAKKFLVYVQTVKNYEFTNNLLIGARKRPQLIAILALTMMVDDVACYQQYFPIDFVNGNVNVSFNLAQGSEGQGFVFPATTCDMLSTYNFHDNTAGSCQVAFMFQKLVNKDCLAASKMYGYASEIGLMANMPGSHTKLIYQDCIFTDNERGITLRYAHDTDDNTCILRNSYFAGYSRPQCPSCYSDQTINYCKRGYAVRMFSNTISGESFPLKKRNIGHDVICTRESYDFKAYLNNVTFENYRTSNTDVPYCSRMSVFKRHNLASDATASHYLTNTKCINCEQTSWAYFDTPDPGLRGWFGGCGQMDCTGPNNYLIHDQDGQYTGIKSQLLSNNSWIGDGEDSCTAIPQINGHWCKFEELAVMQYESIAPDFNKRIMWPVYLKYDGGRWNSSTNGWKEWDWNGPQPMNQRLARFWSVIKLHESYNLTYSGMPPVDTRFQIQERIENGNPADWVIIRIYYPLPNSIEIRIKNSVGSDILVKPFPIVSKIPVDLRGHVTTCGANNFHYNNGTIEFVLTGECQVRVRLTNFIQLSTRLEIPFNDFYKNTNLTSFITNICAFLNIDTGRLKVVGIYDGSAVINLMIDNNAPAIALSTTTTTDPAASYNQLLAIQTKLVSGITTKQLNLGSNVLSFSSSIITVNPDGSFYTPSSDQSKLKLIIGLAVSIPLLLVFVGLTVYCYFKRKRERVMQDDSFEVGSESIDFAKKNRRQYIKAQDPNGSDVMCNN